MNRKSLRAHLANHYEAQTMSADRVDAIVAMARDGAPADAPPPIRAWWARPAMIAAAAVVLLTVTVGLVLTANSGSPPESIVLAEQVSRQIKMFHDRDLTLDVTTDDFATLVAAMDQLEFTPYKPAVINDRGLRLVGARYCGMHGCPAVQMRLVDDQGRQYTLYQVRPDDELKAVARRTVAVDDVPVMLWQEKGLLIGLAGPTGPTL